jgi:hypothetical protein
MKKSMSNALETQQVDLDRAARSVDAFERRTLLLAKITASTVLDAGFARYTYSWEEAILTGGAATSKSPGLAGTAISISELSNALVGKYSYGVDPVNLVGTFAPKAIPNGTFVLITPMRQQNGTLRWVIINTQAIDGACP